MEWREERVKECGRERGEGELLVKNQGAWGKQGETAREARAEGDAIGVYPGGGGRDRGIKNALVAKALGKLLVVVVQNRKCKK